MPPFRGNSPMLWSLLCCQGVEIRKCKTLERKYDDPPL
jgi:hypothetical protein